MSHYATLFICRAPSSFKESRKDHWSWDDGRDGGVLTCTTGHVNPQWSLEVHKRGPLFITLSQGQPDESQGLDQCYIMMALLPRASALDRPLLQADMEVPGFYFSGKPRKQQQISIDAGSVKPGHYILICCTYDPYRHASFNLSVHSTTEGSLGPLKRIYGEV